VDRRLGAGQEPPAILKRAKALGIGSQDRGGVVFGVDRDADQQHVGPGKPGLQSLHRARNTRTREGASGKNKRGNPDPFTQIGLGDDSTRARFQLEGTERKRPRAQILAGARGRSGRPADHGQAAARRDQQGTDNDLDAETIRPAHERPSATRGPVTRAPCAQKPTALRHRPEVASQPVESTTSFPVARSQARRKTTLRPDSPRFPAALPCPGAVPRQ
jgi:hypothetical protein